MPTLNLIAGNGDVVGLLEEAAELARKGELVAVTICACTSSGNVGNQSAWKDDIEFPWSRLLASVADAQHRLLTEGLIDVT